MAGQEAQTIEIQLVKGPKGLGFNIRGGTDNEHRVDDPGIFVTTVREGGAAYEDGRLQPGDKIVEINGLDVTAVEHYEAVQAFHTAKDLVNLRVVRLPYDGPEDHEEGGAQSSSSFSFLTTAVVIGLVGVGAYFAYQRYSKHL